MKKNGYNTPTSIRSLSHETKAALLRASLSSRYSVAQIMAAMIAAGMEEAERRGGVDFLAAYMPADGRKTKALAKLEAKYLVSSPLDETMAGEPRRSKGGPVNAPAPTQKAGARLPRASRGAT